MKKLTVVFFPLVVLGGVLMVMAPGELADSASVMFWRWG
ncbi:MAG: hypothetical protein ACI9EF_003247 [Pseudohongiellaceae bacterium]|jgi:hypothetical protein